MLVFRSIANTKTSFFLQCWQSMNHNKVLSLSIKSLSRCLLGDMTGTQRTKLVEFKRQKTVTFGTYHCSFYKKPMK